ncbi:hypothetical protein [Micromonospora sp. RP3T]|uniref:hypothetical protein n=1 Tax=Micromonospora sp. RP3T TaxID=2135446 RepID=UPI003D712FA3
MHGNRELGRRQLDDLDPPRRARTTNRPIHHHLADAPGEQLVGVLAARRPDPLTTELTAAAKLDDQHYDAVHHLAGNFPGGTADLHFRFTLRDGLIARLVIDP